MLDRRFRPRLRIRAREGLVALTLTATAACAAARRAAEPDAVVPDDVLALEVDNRNWSDVLISVIHDGSRTRFVEVSATKSATLAIPPQLVGSNGTLRLLVHRIGGLDDFLTPVVSVRTGKTVALTIESTLERSSVGVW
jgi:hypothetical protein